MQNVHKKDMKKSLPPTSNPPFYVILTPGEFSYEQAAASHHEESG
jgi:hypothetical protein